jgi:hypothetical protein
VTRQPFLFMLGTALVVAGLWLGAGCTPGPADAGPGTARGTTGTAAATATVGSPTTTADNAGNYRDRVMAWGRQFSTCARSHGVPTFPDPVYPGNAQPSGFLWGFALYSDVDKGVMARALDACNAIAGRMPPAPDAHQPPPPVTLVHMRQYAQCMRQHGLAGFPDPQADGTFPIRNGPYDSLVPFAGKQVPANIQSAFDACLRFQNEWRLFAS